MLSARCVHNTSYNAPISTLFNAFGVDVIWKNNISYAVSGQHHFTHYLSPTDSPQSNFNLFWPDAFFQYKGVEYFSFSSYKSSTGQDANSLLTDPLFTPGALTLQSTSPAIHSGTPLTRTSSAGSGTLLPVLDAHYFSNGYGLTAGDTIQVGTSTAQVISVNYTSNTLTLNTALTWVSNAPVSYPYSGAAPDIGAFAFQGTPSATKLGITQQPGNAVVNQPLSPITIQVQDASGALVPTATPIITISIATNPGNGILGGTIAKQAGNGVATFTDLTLSQPGTGYVLLGSASGLTSVLTTPFTITSAPLKVIPAPTNFRYHMQ